MSSGDEEYNRSGTGEDFIRAQKKGRVGRACDTCRRKKIRCDYASNPDRRCSNCAAYNLDCTYLEAAKKRGPPKGYVENLETRLRKMETLLQRLCPDADFTQELGVSMDRETWWNERNNPNGSATLSTNVPLAPIKKPAGNKRKGGQVTSRNNNGNASEDNISDDESVLPPLSEGIEKLSVGSMDRRFHGKSSGLVLVRTAMDMKREMIGRDTTSPGESQKSYDWNEWENKRTPDTITFDFPPPDLMMSLIQLYFLRNNLYLPLLHRPTFEKQLHNGLHLRDSGFACVLLLVCAVASRFSDDPRVLLSDSSVDHEKIPSQQSAGWKYFDQVQMQRKSLITPVSLHDLQQYALSGIFLHGSAAPYASWVTVGIGLRVAQDVGAHRKRNEPITIESELWKRAFWVLVNLDRLSSAALGRPCAIHDEDFDLDPPLEVDDEYWENPISENAFRQPADKPSTVAFFNSLIKLDQMLSFALRTIYSINKSKIIGVSGENNWAQDTVAELDTMLNKWITTVPDHLRWDPNTPSDYSIFSQQSAILYSTYYYIQILVHRPFIPRPGKPAPLSYPSLDICTNAARSCGQVLDAYRRNCDIGSAPFLMFYAFTSGLVSLLHIWGMRKQGTENSPDSPMQDVHRCMQYLKIAQNKWHLAGRLCEILCELASAGDFPLPQPSPVYQNKRGHDCDNPKVVPGFPPPNAPINVAQTVPQIARPVRNRPIRNVPTTQPRMGGVSQLPINTPEAQLNNLPMYPNEQSFEVGMPWYPQSMNDDQQQQQQQAQQQQQQQQQTFQPPLVSFFPPNNPHNYNPVAETSFQSGGFPPEASNQPNFMDLNPGFPNNEQNPSWGVTGVTLNMWSMAPSGFECEDWNHFVTNIAPGSRPEDQHPTR